jgi:DNA-binding transcriptional MocR family regulator
MPTFQNPLGATMPEAKKRDLVKLLARHGIPLIEDDVYAELHFGRERPRPAKAWDRAGLVMHCGSFSKSLAPGYRVGWCAPGRFARDVERGKLMTSIATSVPVQEALGDYLRHGGYDHHLRTLRAALQTQQAQALKAMREHFPEGTRHTRPAGGYFVWAELPEGCTAMSIYRAALKRGVSVAPGPIFSAKRGFENCLRLNTGHPWSAEIAEAYRTLGRLARA